MGAPVYAIFLLIIFGFVVLITIVLIVVIVKGIRRGKPTLSIIIILAMTMIAGFVYWRYTDDQYQSSKRFWGVYKLERLDGHRCDSCQIIVKKDYEFDITINHKIA